MNGSRVFAVAGAKGGVGKTTTSINLGATLAKAGADVVVVELDIAMANVVDFLDLPVDPAEDPTLHEVLAGECDPLAAVYGAPGGFDVLPSGTDLEGFARTSLDPLGDVVETLGAEYDAVVMDTGAGVSQETLTPLAAADEVLLVSTPRVAAVRNADNTTELVERVDGTMGGLVLTKSGTGNAPDPGRIASFLGLELLGHVPEDDHVPVAQDHGRPVVEFAPDSAAAAAYRDVARALLDADRRTPVSPAEAAGEAVDPEDLFERADGPADREADAGPTPRGATGTGDARGGDRKEARTNGGYPVAGADEPAPAAPTGAERTPDSDQTEATSGAERTPGEDETEAPAPDGDEAEAGASLLDRFRALVGR